MTADRPQDAEPREVFRESSVRLIKQLAEERRDEDTSTGFAVNSEIIGLCETVQALRSRLSLLEADLQLIRDHCRVVCYPPPLAYPIEHTMAANKDQWDVILSELRALDRGRPPNGER